MEAPPNEFELQYIEEVRRHIDEHGVAGIDDPFHRILEAWRNEKITIGVTGEPGSGKSSLVNAIRGLQDDGRTPGAARTGVVETTEVPTAYPFPENNRIVLWDLPGLGTPSQPTLEAYRSNVVFDRFDAFLILSSQRFTENDRQLASEIKSANKPFFFIRTHIDISLDNESRREGFNEDETLTAIRRNCQNNLRGLITRDEDVFLISNRHLNNWEFTRLEIAILNVLPPRQRESFLFTLSCRSKDILKLKVEALRGRIWRVATLSALGAVVPLPGVSLAVDLPLLANELSFYKDQLGLPDENADEFQRMTPEWRRRAGRFLIVRVVNIGGMLTAYAASVSTEEYARFIPILGLAIAGSLSFATTYYFLSKCLDDMKEIAFEFLDAVPEFIGPDNE